MTTATPRSGPVPAPAVPKPGPPPGRAAAAQGAATPPRIDQVPMTGAQSLVRSLEEVGCEVVFGIPGGTILPAYDPLLDSTKVRHVLVRHEQGAGHAATGYAQATGRVGVCMATSGPGRDEPGHADRGRLHGLRPDRRDHRPADPPARSAPTRSRKPTSAASPCRSPSTTSWSPTPRRSRGRSRRRSTWHRPADPARCWWTSRRTCCRRRPPSPGRRSCACPATGRRPGRTASRSARPRS